MGSLKAHADPPISLLAFTHPLAILLAMVSHRLPRTPEPEVMDDDQEVEAYRRADFTDVNRRCARRALRATSRSPGRSSGRAIDLGTGPADIPIAFCRLAPSWRVTAVDLSPGMLRVARVHVRAAGLSARIRLVRGDAKALGHLRPPFDLVMSNSLLHHLHNPVPFWHEVKRFAGRDGAIMVQDLCRPPSRRETRALVRRHAAEESPLLQQLFYQSLLAAFTPAEIRAQLKTVDLTRVTVRQINDRHLTVLRRAPSRAGR